MQLDFLTLETEALKLSVKERASLAEHLIASLDESTDIETEQVWLEEAERRYQGYKRGCLSSRSADEALRDVRAQIR